MNELHAVLPLRPAVVVAAEVAAVAAPLRREDAMTFRDGGDDGGGDCYAAYCYRHF